MAGIGFQLRKILESDSYTGLFKAISFAGLLSSGPWVLSIIGILLVSFLSVFNLQSTIEVRHFQVLVIYLISGSLILSAIFQYSFSRFAADLLYAEQPELVAPNFNGVLFILTILSCILCTFILWKYFDTQDLSTKVLINSSFIILSLIWVGTSLLAGGKAYRRILWAFFWGYFTTLLIGYKLRGYGLNGLLIGFLIGQTVLLIIILYAVYLAYPSKKLILFDWIDHKRSHLTLVFSGLFYNLGLWVDKYIFWFYPSTSQAIFGPLRGSLIYDLPIFWAYLSIIPGMAFYLLRTETNFAEKYALFYDNIINGKTLSEIMNVKNDLVQGVKFSIFGLIKAQVITFLIIFAVMPLLFRQLKISPLYLYLIYLLVIAAALNVIFWGLLNILDYFNKRLEVLFLTGFFVVSNAVFTLLSLKLGVFYYGYGITVSLFIVVLLGFMIINRSLQQLEFRTFMLQ